MEIFDALPLPGWILPLYLAIGYIIGVYLVIRFSPEYKEQSSRVIYGLRVARTFVTGFLFWGFLPLFFFYVLIRFSVELARHVP